MKNEWKEGDLVQLNSRCKSGMEAGTVGRLVKKCGFRRGNGLHFHADLPFDAHDLHMTGKVCRNSDNWMRIDHTRTLYQKNIPIRELTDEEKLAKCPVIELPGWWWKKWFKSYRVLKNHLNALIRFNWMHGGYEAHEKALNTIFNMMMDEVRCRYPLRFLDGETKIMSEYIERPGKVIMPEL